MTRKQSSYKMEIKRKGSQPTTTGSADWFTGNVRIDPLFEAPEPACVDSCLPDHSPLPERLSGLSSGVPARRIRGASVTFEPGARTAWHTHPLGQTLIVTFGLGWAQRWGGPIEEIRPGDVVWIPPGEKHWHGATPTTAMTHIAIQEALNGKAVDWMENVTDEQYKAK
jgi:quercetin dioxygenase-like cupin family protein